MSEDSPEGGPIRDYGISSFEDKLRPPVSYWKGRAARLPLRYAVKVGRIIKIFEDIEDKIGQGKFASKSKSSQNFTDLTEAIQRLEEDDIAGADEVLKNINPETK